MENWQSKLSFTLFILFLLCFVIGGYFLTVYLLNEPASITPVEKKVTEITDHRLDKTKDYVYFSEEDLVIQMYKINYKDIYINLSSGKNLETTLNNEITELEKTIVLEKDATIPEDTEVYPNNEGIYSLSYKDFEVLNHAEYLSIIALNYDYDIVNLTTCTNLDSYIFNKESGKEITNSQLLDEFSKTSEEVVNQINTKLTTLSKEENTTVKLDETTNNLKYDVYVNKIGQLEAIYLVQSTKQNYCDKLVIN